MWKALLKYNNSVVMDNEKLALFQSSFKPGTYPINNLVLKLGLDNSTNTLQNEIGNREIFTLSGSENHQTGKVNNCFYFDSSSYFYNLNDFQNYLDSYWTMNMWVKVDISPMDRFLFRAYSATGEPYFYIGISSDGKPYIRGYQAGYYDYTITSPKAIFLNNWCFITFRINSSNAKNIDIFINGKNYVFNQKFRNATGRCRHVYFGNATSITKHLLMDQVYFYERSLTDNEILQLYNYGNGV